MFRFRTRKTGVWKASRQSGRYVRPRSVRFQNMRVRLEEPPLSKCDFANDAEGAFRAEPNRCSIGGSTAPGGLKRAHHLRERSE
jgi:hypothetical protein